MGVFRVEFGKTPSSAIRQELTKHEYRAWANPGTILYTSEDGEAYATVPKNSSVLLTSYLPEGSRKRKRVPATIEKLRLNNVQVDELAAYGSQETIITQGQTVFVPPNWFNTLKPKQPKATQATFKV